MGPKPTALSAAKRKKAKGSPVGTTFRVTVSKDATVKVTIERKSSGKRSGKRCVARTKKLRKAKNCVRYVRAGVLSRGMKAGKRTIPFSGRLGKKKLALGSYRAVISASNLAGAALKTRTVTFAVVRR